MGIILNETKTIQTKNQPSMIDSVNKRNGHFGWNVQSIQITHVKDSHLEFQERTWDVEIRSVTETTEYATITYTRDRALPRLAELRDMESKYEALENEYRIQSNKWDENKVELRALILVLIGVLTTGTQGVLGTISTLCLIAGIALTALVNVLRAPRRKAAGEAMKEARQKMVVIEEACENLLAEIMQ